MHEARPRSRFFYKVFGRENGHEMTFKYSLVGLYFESVPESLSYRTPKFREQKEIHFSIYRNSNILSLHQKHKTLL